MTALRTAGPGSSRGRRHWPLPTWIAPGAFVASLALFATLSCLARIPPVHPFASVGFFDLKVYRDSVGVVLRGGALYAVRFPGNLGFTYPPLAALVLLPLRLLPVAGDEVLVTFLNAGLLVVIARWTLGLRRPGAAPMDRACRWRITWLAAAVGLWAEPVNSAIGYGQVDLLIAALVVWDLSRSEGAAGRGVAIGLAAGLKLTPLIFIAYLLLSGRLRAGRNAVLSFAATILLGALVLPADSRLYWAGGFLDVSRVSGRAHAGGGPANQSLRGMLLRMLPALPHEQAAWIALAGVVACLGLTLAVRAARRGDGAEGFLLTAITGLLVSPISWTHQWTLAVPGLLLLVTAAGSTRAREARLVGALAFAGCSYAIWIVIEEHPLGMYLGVFGQVAGNLYVLAGLGVLVLASVRELVSARAGAGSGSARLRRSTPAAG